jgi:serine/threonine protein kinase
MATLVSETYYQSQSRVLPYKWASVEVIKFGKYSTASDVWAFGVTLWYFQVTRALYLLFRELFSLGAQPYAGQTNTESTEAVLAGKRLSKPERCPDTIFSIMERCWQERTKDRPTMLEVCESLKRLEGSRTVPVATTTKPEMFYTLDDNTNANAFYKM